MQIKLLPRRPMCWLLIVALALTTFSVVFARDDDDDRDQPEPYKFPPIVKPATFPDPLTLEFAEIEKAMRSGSALLMSMAANREVLQYNRNQLAEQQRAASSSLYGLSTAMSGLTQMKNGLDDAFNYAAAANPGNPPSQTEYVLKGAVEAQLQILSSQISAQAVSAATADKGYAAGGNLSSSVAQLDEAGLQLIFGAYQLYHGYWMIERQISRLEDELDLLQRQLKVVELLQELGRTPVQNVQNLREGIAAMEQGLVLTRLEQQSLLDELNLLLGRSAINTLILTPIPTPDMEVILATDYESAYKAVYKESYLLKAKRYVQGGMQEQYDDVVRNFGELGDRAWRAEQQLEGAKVELKLAEEQLKTRYDKFVAKLLQSIEAYELEQEKLQSASANLERAKARFELGYLSQNDLLRVKNEHSKQAAAVAQLEDDLALSWQRWLLIQKGMDFGNS